MIIDYNDRLLEIYNEEETDFFVPPSKKIIDNTILLLSSLNKKYTSLKNLTIDPTSYGTILLEWKNDTNLLSYEIDRDVYLYTIKKNGEYFSGEDNNLDIEKIITELNILK